MKIENIKKIEDIENIENIKKELLQKQTKEIVGLNGCFLVLNETSINFLEMEEYSLRNAQIDVIDFASFLSWDDDKKVRELSKKVRSLDIDFIEYSLLELAGLTEKQK